MRKSVASIALIRREFEGRTLWLTQWNEGWNAFHFVGGHKRENETFRNCLFREIDEELGLQEGVDIIVAAAPAAHLEYEDVSLRTGEQTAYEIELFDVWLTGSRAAGIITEDPANRWLTESEILSGVCHDGEAVSPTAKRYLRHLGWDLFVSYSHKDDHDGWVTEFVKALQAEYADFTPIPLRVFFDREEIRSFDDWQRRIYDGVHASKLMLAVLSEDYFHSEYCRKEWQMYRDHEIKRQMLGESIAPLYIVTVPGFEGSDADSNADDWKADLLKRQFLDVRQWRPEGINALKELDVQRRLRMLNQQVHERLARVRLVSESKSTVPKASDRFVGRAAELTKLREMLPQGKVAAISAVHGIGGIGKTALAFAYAQAFPDHYPGGRFLVEAAGLDDLRIVLQRLAPDLGVEFTEAEQKDADLAAARVRSAIEQRAGSLLILDNVDRAELLQPRQRQRVLPATNKLHVLVTTRMENRQLEIAGLDCLALDALPESDALELLNKHRPIAGDDEWKAALRIARGLGGHALALEVVAVYLWRHPDISYADYLTRLETEGLLTALTGTGSDPAVTLSEHPEKLIGPLLEPTLERLTPLERRALEYAALLPPDAIALPWIRDLLQQEFPEEMTATPGYPAPWHEIELRLIGLRLWMPTDDQRIVRMHRILQEVTRSRLDPDSLDTLNHNIQQHALGRAEEISNSYRLSEFVWEVEPLQHYALVAMNHDQPGSNRIASYLCDLLQSLGRLNEAAMLARNAVECGTRLSTSNPANLEWKRDLSVSHEKVGNVLTAQGDLSGALQAYQASLAIRERLASADPANAVWQRDLSVSHQKIGNVLRARWDLSGALPAYQRGIEIIKRLLSADPANAGYQRDLSVSHEKIGGVLMGQGDLSGALQAFQKGLDISERLSATDPANVHWQRDLSASHGYIGNVLMAQGEHSGALQAYRVALDIAARLSIDDPANAGLQRDLSISHCDIGDVLETERDYFGALEAYRRGQEIIERLSSADPSNARLERDLSNIHGKIGNVLTAQGDLSGALEAYQVAVDIEERLSAADPVNAHWQKGLAVSYGRIADTREKNGESGQKWWRKAHDVLEDMKRRGLFLSTDDERILQQLKQKLGL